MDSICIVLRCGLTSAFPSPPVGNIWPMMTSGGYRGTLTRSVLCCVMHRPIDNRAQWYAHKNQQFLQLLAVGLRLRSAFWYVSFLTTVILLLYCLLLLRWFSFFLLSQEVDLFRVEWNVKPLSLLNTQSPNAQRLLVHCVNCSAYPTVYVPVCL